MKKMALLAAAAVAVMATPATAGGYVGAAYNSTDSGGSDIDTWQIEGAAGHNAGGWGAQIDGSFGSSDSGGGSEFDHHTLAGHLYWGGAGWRVGGVVATTNLDGGGTEIDEVVYGVEGSHDFGAKTVATASATFGEVDFLGSDLDNWNVDVGVNYYVNPNVRIGGTLGFGNLEFGGVLDADTFTVGVGAEFQPWSAPVSITVGYTHFEVEDFITDVETDSFSVGARWNFGGTLRDRDNSTPFDTRTGLYPRLIDLR